MYTSCVNKHNDIKTKRTSINRKEEEKISSNHTANLTAKTSTYPEQPHCIEGPHMAKQKRLNLVYPSIL